MTSQTEINEIVSKGKSDGVRLINVSTTVFKVLIAFNWVVAIGGGIGAIAAMGKGGFIGGLFVAVGVAVLCSIIYASAVLSTHFAKVLVHLLFANLAMLEKSEA